MPRALEGQPGSETSVAAGRAGRAAGARGAPACARSGSPLALLRTSPYFIMVTARLLGESECVGRAELRGRPWRRHRRSLCRSGWDDVAARPAHAPRGLALAAQRRGARTRATHPHASHPYAACHRPAPALAAAQLANAAAGRALAQPRSALSCRMALAIGRSITSSGPL